MKRSLSDVFFSLSLLIVFVVCSVCLLFYQIQSYEQLRNTAADHEAQHLPIAYLRTLFHQRAPDTTFTSVMLADAPCLRIDDLRTSTSTYIYAYDGYLRELFIPSDAKARVEEGDVLAPLDALSIEQNDQAYTFVFTYQNSSISIVLSTY